MREFGKACFGVAHRRWRIAVDRAEIALAVNQHRAHRPVLRHTHHGIIDRTVAVRMVFTHHIRNRTGGLHIFTVPVVAALMGRIENAPVHGLQPVTHIRQRTAHDHAHGVIEIGTLHLLDDRNRLYAGSARSISWVLLISHRNSRRVS